MPVSKDSKDRGDQSSDERRGQPPPTRPRGRRPAPAAPPGRAQEAAAGREGAATAGRRDLTSRRAVPCRHHVAPPPE
ncbi:hypothetical protein THAOC_26020, partial [Thalassiosira oceanica]